MSADLLSETEINFRRIVSNTFRRLSLDDVQQIAYVRLKGREDTKKYSAAKPQATSLDLMESLEQYGYFSRENVKGLKEVLKDANRSDLADEIDKQLRKPFKKPRNSAAVEAVTPPTEESASRLVGGSRQEREEEQGWEVVSGSHRPPLRHLGSRGHVFPATTAGHSGAAHSTTAGAKQGGQKKVPLMPPLALKKAAQETASLTKTPVGQQLVTLKMQESPASVAQKATNSSPSKPPPPPPPPKNRIYVQEREGGDRDSGLWSGSAYDTVNEWTKHHDKPPTGTNSADGDDDVAAQYQHLVKETVDEHHYTTPELPKDKD